MLLEKDTNQIILTAVQMEGNPIVTGDGIVLNNEYSLIYEIEGRKPVVYTVPGSKIAFDFQAAMNRSSWGGEFDLIKARQALSQFLVLWGTMTTDMKLLKNIKDNYLQEDIAFVKRAIKGNRKAKELLNEALSAYLYIKLMARSSDESDLTTLHIIDGYPDKDMVTKLQNAWKDSAVTEWGHITSYDQLCSMLSTGVLKLSWHSDPKEVMQVH